jgi:hypothetical protein
MDTFFPVEGLGNLGSESKLHDDTASTDSSSAQSDLPEGATPIKDKEDKTQTQFDTYLAHGLAAIQELLQADFAVPLQLQDWASLNSVLKDAKILLDRILRSYPGRDENSELLSRLAGLSLTVRELIFPLLVDKTEAEVPITVWVYRYPDPTDRSFSYHNLRRFAIQKYIARQGSSQMRHIVLLYPEHIVDRNQEFLAPWKAQSRGAAVHGLDLSTASNHVWQSQLYKLMRELQNSQEPHNGNDSES